MENTNGLILAQLNHDPDSVIHLVEKVLSNHGVEPWEYSVDGYADECYCIEKAGDYWEFYFGERGRKCYTEQCDTVVEACRRMIVEKADGEAEADLMLREFSAEAALLAVPAAGNAHRTENVNQHFSRNELNSMPDFFQSIVSTLIESVLESEKAYRELESAVQKLDKSDQKLGIMTSVNAMGVALSRGSAAIDMLPYR